jgi:hypothetical protein
MSQTFNNEAEMQIAEMAKHDSELQDIMVSCIRSTKVMAKVFFPERFNQEFSGLHDQIFDAIDSGERRIVIAAPRGIGKTSVVALALAAKKILFRLCRFFVYVSNSSTSGEMQTDNLKIELLSNPLVKTYFGKLKIKHDKEYDETFSKRAWVAFGDTMVFPRGSGQQVRGILYKNSRPDLIVIDDLEDTETIANEEVRKKRKEWFNADLLKCTSRVEKDWQIVYIDTLKHEDALLQDLIDSPDWLSLRLELFNDEYKSNAPEFVSDEEIAKEVAYHRKQGMMDVLYREYRNIPISKEDASFQDKNFRYVIESGNYLRVVPREHHNEKAAQISMDDLINVVIVDPAKTVKLNSAESAVIGVSIARENQKIFFREVVAEKFYPDELYDAMFAMVVRLKAFHLAVEVTSLHQFISQPIENEMRTRRILAQYHELKAVGKKEERIAWLAPYYRLGYIYHVADRCVRLESQLLGYPRSKYWDVMDAAAYVIKMLDELALYFDPPDDDPNEDLDPEEEFRELKNDPLMERALVI